MARPSAELYTAKYEPGWEKASMKRKVIAFIKKIIRSIFEITTHLIALSFLFNHYQIEQRYVHSDERVEMTW